MALRQAFAKVLRQLRSLRALSQHDFASLSQSQVSSLESGNSSPSLDTAQCVAEDLDISPATLIAITCAADQGLTPRELLRLMHQEIEALELLDAEASEEVPPASHPNAIRAMQMRLAVQELKAQGLGPTEVSRRLEIHLSTVKRHWKADT